MKPVVEKEPTEQNPSETHEGGPEKDDPENKRKTEEAQGAGEKKLDWSDQDEHSFAELDVAETDELEENDLGELGQVVQIGDESENKMGLGEALGTQAKKLDSSDKDESSFEEVDVAETEKLAEHNPCEPGRTRTTRRVQKNSVELWNAVIWQ